MVALVNNPNWQNFASSLEQDRGLTPGLLSAVAQNETAGGHPDLVNATSPAGAQGMFQFMPDTAKQYNVNTADTADSTRGAADYLSDLQKKYNDPLLAGAAYNMGPGNLDNAIKAAQGAGVPTDAMSLATHGFLPKETSAYVAKLSANLPAASGPTPFSPDVINATRQTVVNMVVDGDSPTTIVQTLSKTKVAPMISKLEDAGVSHEDIVQQIGGQPLADAQAKMTKVDQQGPLQNIVDAAGNALGDLKRGAQQLGSRMVAAGAGTVDPETGETLPEWQGQSQADITQQANANLAKSQAEQQAANSDPGRIELGRTVAGNIGDMGVKAIPSIAAAVGTGGSALPLVAGQGLVGVAQGALTPTTGAGQIIPNVLTQGTLGTLGGAGGAVAGKVLGKVLGATGSKLSELGTPGVDTDAVNAALRSSHQDLAQAVGQKLGVPNATAIDSDLVQAADNVYKPMFDAAAAGNSVTVPQGFTKSLTAITDKLNTTPRPLSNLLSAVKDGDVIPADDWLKIRSDIGADARAATGSDSHYLSNVVDHFDDVMENSSTLTPDQLANLQQARGIYRNLQPVIKMVKSSNNSGTVQPNQFVNAIKGDAANYARNNAPLQDLQPLADKISALQQQLKDAKVKTPSSTEGFGAYALGEALGHVIPGASTVVYPGRILVKMLASMPAGQAVVRGAGTAATRAGNTVANSSASGLIGSLIAKGLGRGASPK